MATIPGWEFHERDVELAHVRGSLERVDDGAEAVVVVDGAAGMGKSRLLAEAAAIARSLGIKVGVTPSRSERDRGRAFRASRGVVRRSRAAARPRRAMPASLRRERCTHIARTCGFKACGDSTSGRRHEARFMSTLDMTFFKSAPTGRYRRVSAGSRPSARRLAGASSAPRRSPALNVLCSSKHMRNVRMAQRANHDPSNRRTHGLLRLLRLSRPASGSPVAAFPLVRGLDGSPRRTRTFNPSVNSRMLCQLSYRGSLA